MSLSRAEWTNVHTERGGERSWDKRTNNPFRAERSRVSDRAWRNGTGGRSVTETMRSALLGNQPANGEGPGEGLVGNFDGCEGVRGMDWHHLKWNFEGQDRPGLGQGYSIKRRDKTRDLGQAMERNLSTYTQAGWQAGRVAGWQPARTMVGGQRRRRRL